jgi:hypothetical protein
MIRRWVRNPDGRVAHAWAHVSGWSSRVFKPASRYPADPRAVFILALSVFGGLTALVLDAAPETLNAVLPGWVVMAWGALLTAGSAITLAGMARQTINGVIVEQVGSATVGATTIFYSGVAIFVVGPSALQPLGIVLAWGLACLIRWGQLEALLNREYEAQLEAQVEAEVKRRIGEP